ncbi:MAG: FHA domain-containing protein [Planctomycetota bacterium]
MARFQLLVSEPDQAPRVAVVDKTMVIGRSSRADFVVADDEVGREQMQLVVDGADLKLRSIGKTNPTIVDGRAIAPGETVMLRVGSVILVGRTRLQVQPVAAAAVADAIGEATIPQAAKAAIAPPTESLRPQPASGAPAAERQPPGSQAPDSGTHHLQPGQRSRPPAAPTPPPADDPVLDGTIQVPHRGKQPVAPPAAPPAARPPAAPAPNPAPPPPAADLDLDGGTIQLPHRGKQPVAPPAAPPAARPPAAPATPPRPPAPVPAAPAAATVPPPPAPLTRPPTVAFDAPRADGPLPTPALPTTAAARLFLRGPSLRRVVRLHTNPARIGRDENLDAVLPDESISGVHAEIRFDGARWLVLDRDSRNGTVADGDVLRGRSKPIARNAILGFGNVRAVFLVDDPARKALDRRLETRALQALVRKAQLTAAEARQVLERLRRDERTSIPEIVLRDTAVDVGMWSEALAAAAQPTWFDRLCAIFRRRPSPPPSP